MVRFPTLLATLQLEQNTPWRSLVKFDADDSDA